MMKKLLFLFVLLFVTNTGFAQTQPTPTILHPIPNENSGDKEKPNKAPLAPVYVYQYDHTLTFESTQVGAILSIVKEDEEVFSDIVDPTCTVIIPTNVTGAVEIFLAQDGITYWALIVL